jgi:ubiquitin-protein ligase
LVKTPWADVSIGTIRKKTNGRLFIILDLGYKVEINLNKFIGKLLSNLMHNKFTFAGVITYNPSFPFLKPVAVMERKSMYFDVNHTKICREHYRPSTSIKHLLKSVWTVLMIGDSPINHSNVKRRIH